MTDEYETPSATFLHRLKAVTVESLLATESMPIASAVQMCHQAAREWENALALLQSQQEEIADLKENVLLLDQLAKNNNQRAESLQAKVERYEKVLTKISSIDMGYYAMEEARQSLDTPDKPEEAND